MLDAHPLWLALLPSLWWLYRSLKRTQPLTENDLPLPPGPPPKILIGNTLDIPQVDQHRVYAKWGEMYNSRSGFSPVDLS